MRAGDNQHVFKKAGNKAQFKFTTRLLDHIQGAQECMKRKNDEGYEKATQEMDAGETLLINRQKMIKLADHSELGWSVVEEYEADELADNSKDEKRMARAEKEAERKALKRKKRFADGQSFEEQQKQRSSQHTTPRFGQCFGCGEVGHIREFCPKLLSGSEPAKVVSLYAWHVQCM